MTTRMRIGAAACAVAAMMLVGSSTWAGEGEGGRGKHGDRGQGMRKRIMDGKWEERIDHRIERIKEAIAKHPNAPADLKALAEKVIAGLMEVKGDMEKLKAALQAHDKDALKGLRDEAKADREKVHEDAKALREAIRAAFKDGREGGGKEGRGEGRKFRGGEGKGRKG